jgi:acetoacetyl-CoA synthetase
MWNWLVSGLASQARIVLYEGNPAFPGPERLWQLAESEQINIFGTSAKYIDAIKNSGYRPAQHVELTALHSILSTGSPLSSDGFAFVYDAINPDVSSVPFRVAPILCLVLFLAARFSRFSLARSRPVVWR